MIDIEKLSFGDKLYRVVMKINPSNRITMVDNDGNTWYRYKDSTKRYEIQQYEYVGKIITQCYGDTDVLSSGVEYMLKYKVKDEYVYHTIDESDIEKDMFKLTEQEAKDLIVELCLTT